MSNELSALKAEVQRLSDLVESLKRNYDDLLYNLDDDNLSEGLIKEKKGMKASIKVNADSIVSKVSAADVDTKLTNYSTITQTATSIASEVTARQNADSALSTSITQTATSIASEVTARQNADSALSTSITQTATAITSVVQANYSNPVTITSIADPDNRTDKSKLYYYSVTKVYYFWSGSNWESTTQANFGTVFEQTTTGFKLKGNVTIDGSLIATGIIKGPMFRTIGDTGGDTGNYLKIGNTTSGIGGDITFFYNSDQRGHIQQAGGAFSIWPGADTNMVLGATGRSTLCDGNWTFRGSVTGVTAKFA